MGQIKNIKLHIVTDIKEVDHNRAMADDDSILGLPAELQEHIFDYCSMNDLTNLSSTNKRYYHCIKHLLWREIEIPWKSIQKESVFPRNLDRLKLTKHINFSDKDDGNGFVVVPSKWVHVSSGFKKLLKACNRNKLVSIRVCGLVADNAVKTLCTLLHHLQDLWLAGCHYTTIAAWKTVADCTSLRKLTIEDCRVFNIGIQTISKSSTLVDVGVQRCQLITDPCIESLLKMGHLERLTLVNNRNLTRKGMQCLGQHRNLKHLEVSYNEIDSNGNTCLCHFSVALDRVDGNQGIGLRVDGFSEFTPVSSAAESTEGAEVSTTSVVASGSKVCEDKIPSHAINHFRKMQEVEEDMELEDLVIDQVKDGKCRLDWKSVF